MINLSRVVCALEGMVKAMMYDALYGRQSIEKKDSISVESQLEYCRYETHGEPYIEYVKRHFKWCSDCAVAAN